MEYLPTEDTFSYWLTHYGGFALFTLLALEIIALPIPGETLMVLAGVLLNSGDLSFTPTLIAAYSGSICGIHASYLLGRTAGHTLIKKYGSRVGLTEKTMQRVHDWFARFGKWTLIIGYFVPGVRHFTGICAGMSQLEYHDFAIFACTGAVIWVTTFLSLGYCFGDYWLMMFDTISSSLTFSLT